MMALPELHILCIASEETPQTSLLVKYQQSHIRQTKLVCVYWHMGSSLCTKCTYWINLQCPNSARHMERFTVDLFPLVLEGAVGVDLEHTRMVAGNHLTVEEGKRGRSGGGGKESEVFPLHWHKQFTTIKLMCSVLCAIIKFTKTKTYTVTYNMTSLT